jgi:thiaminase
MMMLGLFEVLFCRKYADEDGNQYFRWIENYVADDFLEAVKVGRNLLETHAVKLSPERVEEIVEIFREGSRLEALFWGMGLEYHGKTELTKSAKSSAS